MAVFWIRFFMMTVLSLVVSYLAPAYADLTDLTCDVADKDRLDCGEREPRAQDPTWDCERASNWGGDCIPGYLFDGWGCLELDDDAFFCEEGAPFNVTVLVTHDDVTLDCNDQVIDHDWADGAPARSAIQFPYEYSVGGVDIRNCRIRDVGRYGVSMKRFFRAEQLEGEMRGHEDVDIANISIRGTGGTGIFVGQNSQAVTIRNANINGAYTGIYLEAGSTRTRILEGRITNSREREAISIDSSEHNVIDGVYFEGNPGAIHLYKNCGENCGQVCPIKRPRTASHNIIRNNVFNDDSVQVAWRQHKIYTGSWCAEISKSIKRWRDKSAYNVIANNLFQNGAVLYLQDGPNTVFGNHFVDADLFFGKEPSWGVVPIHTREISGQVVENVLDADSRVVFEDSGFSHEDLVLRNNRDALGPCLEENLCEGALLLWGKRVISGGLLSVLF